MIWIAQHVWLVPLLPLVAAGLIAVTRRPHRDGASGLALAAMVGALGLSLGALVATLTPGFARTVVNTPWFTSGQLTLQLGWILDPLSAAMLVMITLVGSLIFVFSTGYMADDPNYTRFFGFLSLFAAAMLGLVIANSLLVLFVCWELVGLASYLLIGFWFTKPSAAAAARKAFLTTRIGDLGLFAGMLWLNSKTGTLLFYDSGKGCLEETALITLTTQWAWTGVTLGTAIGLLLFVGAAGKSGQFPLHVWLPDAMEGPTPVSALIHAATMVAAGVFLMARVSPLTTALPDGLGALVFSTDSPTSAVMAWVGAFTSLFAALCAVAQTDLKRILAYSTISQLGLMFVGLGTAGFAVAILHLLTHAFFKALLFLGAGSVIHACHHEQDIRRLGGLRKGMPVTFATYAVGMMALSGVPVFFAGFWSKDAILHGAFAWSVSLGPFLLCLLGAVLTAFYMTRQMCFVFFGSPRNEAAASDAPRVTFHEPESSSRRDDATGVASAVPSRRFMTREPVREETGAFLEPESSSRRDDATGVASAVPSRRFMTRERVREETGAFLEPGSSSRRDDATGVASAVPSRRFGARETVREEPGALHESPRRMTVPLLVLATFTVLLSALCTPFWPGIEEYLGEHAVPIGSSAGLLGLLALSVAATATGIGLAWRVYRRIRLSDATADPLAERFPAGFGLLHRGFGVDALYAATVTRWGEALGTLAAWLDRWLWHGLVDLARTLGQLAGWVSSRVDEGALNGGFDSACDATRGSGRRLAGFHNGRAHRYLRVVAMGVTLLGLLLFGWMKS